MVKPIFGTTGEFMGLQLRPELAKSCFMQSDYYVINIEKSMRLCAFVNRMLRDFKDYWFKIQQLTNE